MVLEKNYEGINKESPNFMLLQILRVCNSTIIKQTGLVKSCKTINLQRDLDELLYCLYQMTLDFLGIFHQNYLFFSSSYSCQKEDLNSSHPPLPLSVSTSPFSMSASFSCQVRGYMYAYS